MVHSWFCIVFTYCNIAYPPLIRECSGESRKNHSLWVYGLNTRFQKISEPLAGGIADKVFHPLTAVAF